jgi:O-antigen ligase
MLSKIDFRQYLIIALSIAIFTTPLGVVMIKGWAGYHLFICTLLSLILLWINRQHSTNLDISDRSQIRIMAWVFTLPFLATLTAQLLRNDFDLPALDSPARFILAIPILYGLIFSKMNIERLLVIAIPLSAIATYLLIPYLPQKGWALNPGRLATYSVDPLTFGKISLALGLMSAFIAIKHFNKPFIFIAACSGTFIGIYLSIESASKTGWLAIPLVLAFLTINFLIQPISLRKKIFLSTVCSILIMAPFLLSTTVKERTFVFIQEFQQYHSKDSNRETSTGARISFYIIGSKLFLEKPLEGWGDKNFENRLSNPDFIHLASNETKLLALGAGFHSDIMQNAVRSGLGGLIAYICIFLVPLVYFIKLYLKNQSCRLISGIGIIYVCVELVSSLSTEVLSLKSTASFYGLMIAFLMAGSFNMKYQQAKQI